MNQGILTTVQDTIAANRVHPTIVLNALIVLENNGGAPAVYELEYSLARMTRTSYENHNPNHRILKAWLEATRAYLETHCPKTPVKIRGVN